MKEKREQLLEEEKEVALIEKIDFLFFVHMFVCECVCSFIYSCISDTCLHYLCEMGVFEFQKEKVTIFVVQ